MKSTLLNHKMHDGTRKFVELPEECSWDEFRRHIANLPGTKVTNHLTDHVTEMWLDFSFRGHDFTVNNQFGDYWFFVRDAFCPDDILVAVIEHCETLLTPRR